MAEESPKQHSLIDSVLSRIHKPQDSLLSSSIQWTNFRGVFNLCVIVLVLSNARVALENLIKYGILVDPISWARYLIFDYAVLPAIYIVLCLNFHILFALWIEKKIAENRLSDGIARHINLLNLSVMLLAPPMIIFRIEVNPVASSLALGVVCTVFLKLVSYHMVLFWCRQRMVSRGRAHKRNNSVGVEKIGEQINERSASPSKNPEGKVKKTNSDADNPHIVVYPDNLTLRDIYYFMFVPTMCYELNFPRSQRIRKRFLIKRICEWVIFSQLMMAVCQQWMIPIINNSLQPLKEMNYPAMLERLLKLAVPNLIFWLIFFYCFFHSYLNTLAELFRFADREFYRDWWNSETIQYFWQNWNIPVHRWCVRHLYKPLLSQGVSRQHAMVTVFLISAFFHEYLVSVPLKMFRCWAFLGMLAQIPAAFLVDNFINPQYANIGNMAVWMSLIIGQPLAILMYYHDYYVIHYAQPAAMTTPAPSLMAQPMV